MQSNPSLQSEISDRIASLYLIQLFNFMHYLNIINTLSVIRNTLEANSNQIIDFLTGNVLSYSSFDCVYPSNYYILSYCNFSNR